MLITVISLPRPNSQLLSLDIMIQPEYPCRFYTVPSRLPVVWPVASIVSRVCKGAQSLGPAPPASTCGGVSVLSTAAYTRSDGADILNLPCSSLP